MKISLSPIVSPSLEALLAVAPLAEELGYHGLWRAEGVHWDAFTVCSQWAARTSRILVGTAIVSAVTRDPGALARAAITVQEQSRGRFRLGLGVGNNPEVPQPASPLKEMARVTAAVRGCWRDKLVPDVTQPAPPIWLAALRPKMVELAAKVADGLLLNWITPEFVRTIRAQVGPKVALQCNVRAFAASPAEAIAAVRENLPFYRALPVYRKALELQGLDPDNLSDQDARRLVICDRADFDVWRDAGVDELCLRPVGADTMITIKRLAPGR